MFPLGHAGITLLLFAPVAYVLVIRDRERTMAVGLVVLLLVTLSPDLDVLISGLPHRGPTHSLGAAIGLGLVAGAVGWASALPSPVRRLERAGMGLFAGFFGVASHMVGDVITPMGIEPFFPVVSARVTLDLVSARHPGANVGLFVLGSVAFRLALHCAKDQPVPTGPTPGRTSVDPDTAPR